MDIHTEKQVNIRAVVVWRCCNVAIYSFLALVMSYIEPPILSPSKYPSQQAIWSRFRHWTSQNSDPSDQHHPVAWFSCARIPVHGLVGAHHSCPCAQEHWTFRQGLSQAHCVSVQKLTTWGQNIRTPVLLICFRADMTLPTTVAVPISGVLRCFKTPIDTMTHSAGDSLHGLWQKQRCRVISLSLGVRIRQTHLNDFKSLKNPSSRENINIQVTHTHTHTHTCFFSSYIK